MNEILNQSTLAQRAEYVARVEEARLSNLKHMRAQLAANAMDLDIVAPYPSSYGPNFHGRKAYRIAMSLRNHYQLSFVSTGATRSFKDPCIVVEKPDAEAKVRAAARVEANACFDAYLLKLEGKIAKPIRSAVLTGRLWDGSTLTVTLDFEVQVWDTKCILNVSCLGKLFNQWPTRRVS